YRDFPFPPHAIRSLGVEIHMGAVGDGDYARGIDGPPKPGQQRTSILRTRDDAGDIRGDTCLLIGVMDSICMEQAKDGPVVHLEGRDIRSILLDAPVPTALYGNLNLKRPIEEVVSTICHSIPLGQGFDV